MITTIIIREHFEALHRWKDACGDVAFLSSMHRHIFFVELEVEVHHDDREIEFILMKRELKKFLETIPKESELSCEMMAKKIISWVHQIYGMRSVACSVFEDNENGAKVRT